MVDTNSGGGGGGGNGDDGTRRLLCAALRRNALLKGCGLTEHHFSRMVELGFRRTYAAGETVFAEGDDADGAEDSGGLRQAEDGGAQAEERQQLQELLAAALGADSGVSEERMRSLVSGMLAERLTARALRAAAGGGAPLLFVRDSRNVQHAERTWLDGARSGLGSVSDVQAAIDALRSGVLDDQTRAPRARRSARCRWT